MVTASKILFNTSSLLGSSIAALEAFRHDEENNDHNNNNKKKNSEKEV